MTPPRSLGHDIVGTKVNPMLDEGESKDEYIEPSGDPTVESSLVIQAVDVVAAEVQLLPFGLIHRQVLNQGRAVDAEKQSQECLSSMKGGEKKKKKWGKYSMRIHVMVWFVYCCLTP